MQVKCNNEVGDAIRNLKHPVFIFPEMPEDRFELNKGGNQVYQRPNEMKVFMWKKQWEQVNTREAKYLKYQMTAYPIIMGQCSPALKVQLEGSKGYEKIL